MNRFDSEIPESRITRLGFVALIVVSVLVAILLASALNSFTRVSDSALADTAPTATPRANAPSSITPAKRDYLPIIFLNSATAGGAWLLSGNTGTNASNDFLGTTDKMTLTIRVSNTVAYRIVPSGANTPNIIGGASVNNILASLYGATIGGGGKTGNPNVINTAGNYATISGGWGNTASGDSATVSGGNTNLASGTGGTVGGGALSGASGNYGTIGGGYFQYNTGNYTTIGGGNGNSASADNATIGGGYQNNAKNTYTMIGGGYQNTASGQYAIVGGGYQNIVSGTYAIVGGGYRNIVSGTYTTIGGGQQNTSSNNYATVGGGSVNTASGSYSTVGGGFGNGVSGGEATIGGGEINTASNYYATVGGGAFNTASGSTATVPGGYQNSAAGDYSFAAGRNAHANHEGSFVWVDSAVGAALPAGSSAANQFRVYATGGVDFFTGINLVTGVETGGCSLPANSGTWNCTSDRNVKANFQDVEPRDILARVNTIPIQEWKFVGQADSIRHIGPMAQDFYAAFGVGDDDKHIGIVDAQGVALAAIQGLSQENNDLKAQVASLQSQNDARQNEIAQLKQDNADIKARVSALEQGTGQTNPLQGKGASALPISRDALFIGALVVVVGIVVGRRKHA